MTAPKAFISHASEDKQRFVNGFAGQLRAKGIDAWLDAWEIKAGDSLVDKIFEEGIKQANAFVIVISATSISKNWVREELDSGMVRKIEKACRLIPVVIDECEIPQTIKHLKWVRIRDLSKYDDELSEIANAILGAHDKPPLGNPPAHFTATIVDYIPELTKADNLVFGVLGRYYLKKGEPFFQTSEVFEALMALGFSEEEVDDSLRILASRNYLSLETIQGIQIWGIELFSHSLENFLRREVPGYDQNVLAIVSGIVNEGLDSNVSLHEKTSITMPIIMHSLNLLKDRGLLRVTGPAGFQFLKIISVSPELRRIMRQG